ncbi:MAG: fructosamine kinase family protein [Mycobacteriales bacterium]
MSDLGRYSALTGWPCRYVTPVAGGSICRSFRAEGYDGAAAFVKTLADAPNQVFDAEARSLRWLADAGGAETPVVLGSDAHGIALGWIESAPPTPTRAEQFGRDLATTHRGGADRFGADWPAYAGYLALPNCSGPTGAGPTGAGLTGAGPTGAGLTGAGLTGAGPGDPAPDWPAFLGGRRIEPLLRRAIDSGSLPDADPIWRVIARLPALVDASEAPSRVHGDLWSGNVIFTETSAAIVDPSAYGGHREADLAMLALFGAPHLDRILGSYDEEFPLLDGWRVRLGVHQLVPLLAHTIIFGGGYGAQTIEMARRYR